MKALSFEGTGIEYFKIWIVNIFLTIITVGLYYPWAKVRNNRYLYANSTLEGRNFEYHATGKQLFIGYLIAMVLLIIYIAIESVFPIGSAILAIVFFAAIPWIIWRSLKFNLNMTSYSNVRFSFDGVLSGAYINFMLLPIAFFIALYAVPIIAAIFLPNAGSSSIIVITLLAIVLLTLSFYLFALMKKRNTSYLINGYRFGQGSFSTNLEVKPFALILLKSIGLSILLIFALMLVISIVSYVTVGVAALSTMMQDMSQNSENGVNPTLLLIIFPLYLGFIFVSFIILAYSYTRQRTYIMANSSLDEKINFASTLKAQSFAWVMSSNFIVILLTFGLAYPWAKVRMTRLVLENTLVDTSIGFDDYVSNKQQEQSSLGEQIGDAFDVDVGLGF